MKRITQAIATALALVTYTANASLNDFFSADAGLALTSDYVWRGISQNDGQPAFQPELTINSKPGFYASLWESNTQFVDDLDNTARYEFQYGMGYKFENDTFTADFGLLRYSYPNTSGADYNEGFLNLKYKILCAEVNYSNDEFGNGDGGVYYAFGLDIPLPEKWVSMKHLSIGGHVGQFDFSGPLYSDSNYMDYQIFIKKSFSHAEFELSWTDTNHHFGEPELNSSRIIFTASIYT